MLLIQLLTVAHFVIHIGGNKGYIYGNVKDCNFKTSKNLWKIWKNLERKAHGTTKTPFTPNTYIRSMN